MKIYCCTQILDTLQWRGVSWGCYPASFHGADKFQRAEKVLVLYLKTMMVQTLQVGTTVHQLLMWTGVCPLLVYHFIAPHLPILPTPGHIAARHAFEKTVLVL